MPGQKIKDLEDVVAAVDQYPLEAFLFVREGLNFAVERIHGPESREHKALARYLIQHDLDWSDLEAMYHAGELPEPVADAIDDAGGCDKLNRHVGGAELCWGLRDFALERWGMLSRTVLESWHVKQTRDFGEIVFAFINHDLMQKQDDDTINDFIDVYTFDEAFEEPFRRPGWMTPGSPESN